MAIRTAFVTLWSACVAGEWCWRNKGQCYGNQYELTEVEALGQFEELRPWFATVRLGDIDSDGDMDALVLRDGKLWFYERLGGNLSEGRQVLVNFSGPSLSKIRNPTVLELTDWDGDGDLDVIMTDEATANESDCPRLKLRYLEHVQNANAANASFSLVEGEAPKLVPLSDLFECSLHMVAQVVDWDQDGREDMLFWSHEQIRYFRNRGGELHEVPEGSNPFNGLALCKASDRQEVFRVTDWDDDGDFDIIVACYSEHYAMAFRGVIYAEQLADGTFMTAPGGVGSVMSFGTAGFQAIDWNGDGLTDLFTGSSVYVRSRSTAFVERKESMNPFAGLSFTDGRPQLVDWNMDGHLDLLVAEPAKLRLFTQVQGRPVEDDMDFDLVPLVWNGARTGITAVDWDSDGDTDLVVTSSDGLIRVFDNDGVQLRELNASQHFLGVSVPLKLSQWHRQEGQPLQLIDWDQDGDLDLLLGPGVDGPCGAAFFEQVAGKLVRRENHSFCDLPSTGDFQSDWAWKVMDCDGDGDLDLIRYWYEHYKHYSYQGAVSCKQEDGRLRCDMPCFPQSFPDDRVSYAMRGLAAGDWDNDGDIDLLVLQNGADQEPYVRDPGFCTPPQVCSGRGSCLGSGQCSCNKDRSLSDCSGCAVGYYTSSYKFGNPHVHSCLQCPCDSAGAACAARGVCVDDAYAQFTMDRAMDRASRPYETVVKGNGSCICAAEAFGGFDSAGHRTCTEGGCPAGHIETYMNVTRLGHPSIHHSLSCQICPAGSFADSQECRQCRPGRYATLGSSACAACQAGKYSQTLGASECKDCPIGRHAPEASLSCFQGGNRTSCLHVLVILL